MSRRKVWWLVTWDVPTFEGSPGTLVYTEVVKSRHPQIAAWKAVQRFREKMKWIMDSSWKALGGEKTAVHSMIGPIELVNRMVGEDKLRIWRQLIRQRDSLPGHRESFTTGLALGSRAEIDGALVKRFELLSCAHRERSHHIRWISHSAGVKVETCNHCGFTRNLGWYQEGENWHNVVEIGKEKRMLWDW